MAAFCPESSSNPFPRSRTTLSIWWEVILGAQSDTESGRLLTPLPSFSGSFFFQLKKKSWILMSFPRGCPCIGCVSGANGSQKKACSRGVMGLKPRFYQRVASAFNHKGISATTFFFLITIIMQAVPT